MLKNGFILKIITIEYKYYPYFNQFFHIFIHQSLINLNIDSTPGTGGSGHTGGEITIRTTLRTQGCDEVHDIKRLTMSIYFKTLFVTLRRGKADMSLQLCDKL